MVAHGGIYNRIMAGARTVYRVIHDWVVARAGPMHRTGDRRLVMVALTFYATNVARKVTAMNIPTTNRYIGYYRVSTSQQGRSGLGIDAQQHAVQTYLKGAKLISEFTEVESGRRSDRPKLAEALAACRLHRATLVIAKLVRFVPLADIS
jgi:hypothetical protein